MWMASKTFLEKSLKPKLNKDKDLEIDPVRAILLVPHITEGGQHQDNIRL